MRMATEDQEGLMDFIGWAKGGAPPEDLLPGNYKVYIVSVVTETGHTVTTIRYLGPA